MVKELERDPFCYSLFIKYKIKNPFLFILFQQMQRKQRKRETHFSSSSFAKKRERKKPERSPLRNETFSHQASCIVLWRELRREGNAMWWRKRDSNQQREWFWLSLDPTKSQPNLETKYGKKKNLRLCYRSACVKNQLAQMSRSKTEWNMFQVRCH